ncbi:hypothetical protein SEETMRM10961_1750 [Salmonella enterica subsp. enterica serovar Typhimurium]|nr:hypothetical protein SEETMRM10961_1750 [Salmonella enterica subsp. enterica serovar Typhimurium]
MFDRQQYLPPIFTKPSQALGFLLCKTPYPVATNEQGYLDVLW